MTAPARPPRALELSQIRLLVALLTEQSVSRAAQRLGQSQPQVSASLKRIRALLGDPVLVRTGNGMVATDTALRMLAPAMRIVQDMHALHTEAGDFEAGSTPTTLRIAIPDLFGSDLVGSMIGELRREAPGALVVVVPVAGESEALKLLESGSADLLLESNILRAPGLRHAGLFSEGVLSVAARRHAGIHEGLTLPEYLDLPHVAAAPASGANPGIVDRMLAARGHARRVVAWMPYLNAMPSILAQSDLVLTTTEHMARQFATLADLQVFQPPLRLPAIRHYMMWHERVHRSARNRWLRRLIRDAASA